MDETTARQCYWIRALASVDGGGQVFTKELRAAAARRAELAGDSFHAANAGRWLFAELNGRHPQAHPAGTAIQTPAWLQAGLPLLAFVLGVAADVLAADRRINLLAIPVLALLAWNGVMYLALLGQALAGRDVSDRGLMARWFIDLFAGRNREEVSAAPAAIPAREPLEPPALTRLWRAANREFLRQWLAASRPLLLERAKLLLHAAAIAAATGVVAGMYLRGLAFEYRVGWGSTFLGAEGLHGLLATLLGPASLVTGIGIPDAAQLRTLAWSANPAGTPAGDWIHLYAATCALFIATPRLLLMLAGAWQLRRWRAEFPVPPEPLELPAGSALEDSDSPKAVRVAVIPFNTRLSPRARELIRLHVFGEAGGPVNLDFREPVAYGDEEELATGPGSADKPPGAYVLVFDLCATPETEVHGAAVAKVAALAARGVPPAVATVQLDGLAFRERFRAEAGYAHRLKERRETWSRFLNGLGLKAHFLDPEDGA